MLNRFLKSLFFSFFLLFFILIPFSVEASTSFVKPENWFKHFDSVPVVCGSNYYEDKGNYQDICKLNGDYLTYNNANDFFEKLYSQGFSSFMIFENWQKPDESFFDNPYYTFRIFAKSPRVANDILENTTNLWTRFYVNSYYEDTTYYPFTWDLTIILNEDLSIKNFKAVINEMSYSNDSYGIYLFWNQLFDNGTTNEIGRIYTNFDIFREDGSLFHSFDYGVEGKDPLYVKDSPIPTPTPVPTPDVNDTITNPDVGGATGSFGDFFDKFSDNDHGLSGIIKKPLELISEITSNSCKAIPMNLMGSEFELPCMSSLVYSHFPELLNIYQTITFGLIAYAISVNIFAKVREFRDPDSDKIEVIDL